MTTGTAAHHPCRWTPAILDAIRPTLEALRLPVHDPFAGTGERLGVLCDRLGLAYTGTELRAEYITDPRVRAGDSTDPLTYPAGPHVIVTSPAYTGGISDNYARLGDRRHTYQQASTDILGYIPDPRPNDMGLLGNVRKGSKPAEAEYWRIAAAAVKHWPEHVVVNVDSQTPMVGGGWYPLADRWRALLTDHGWQTSTLPVTTPRQRQGANGHRRAAHETVLVGNRPSSHP